ncbi:aldose 1-epimerase family protein [Ferrovibrio sp.]|uniref:aldose 1-epimerase family protein n=1 Tax=Ferrovibrio sp. TaxID=1917215 RepID=UPI0025C457D7|nr:aldose 1-epimerase family protein [Ferrovibrio sp.]
MVSLFGQHFTRMELFRRIGRLEQVAGIIPGSYDDGPERSVRYLDLRSGGGLEARVMVDRGFDIGELRFNGLPLSWRSANGFRAPGLHIAEEEKGAGLLRSMDGMMVTCGLDHVRGAAEGPASHFGPRRESAQYPLHGRISQTPARFLGQGETWEGDDCRFYCEGAVRQSMMYGETLELRRRIEMPLGGATLTIIDQIRNAGYRPTPHMQLYHLNFGFPLLDAGAALLLPPGREPRPDTHTAFLRQQGPFAEAVDEILEVNPLPGPNGRVSAALVNATLGSGLAVQVEYDASTLPALQIWRHFGPGMNVLAIEPATNRAGPRAELERGGQIRFLEPGEEIVYCLTLSVHAGAAALEQLSGRIGSP